MGHLQCCAIALLRVLSGVVDNCELTAREGASHGARLWQGIVFGRAEDPEVGGSSGRGVEADPIGSDAAALERMERVVAPQVML